MGTNIDVDSPKVPSVYTGIVCRRCTAPVARIVNEATLQCPACGHSWNAGPPVRLEAA